MPRPLGIYPTNCYVSVNNVSSGTQLNEAKGWLKSCRSCALKVKRFGLSVYKSFLKKVLQDQNFRNIVSLNIQIPMHFSNLYVGFVLLGVEKGSLEIDVGN